MLEELLNRSISFSRSITTDSNSVIIIINHSRKPLLFDKTSPWVKKGIDSLFDVTIGSDDGIEIYELVGLYLLNRLSTAINKSGVGLYRDDGLAAINNANGPKLDRVRKDIIALFKEKGLSIIIETNLIETDFLDFTSNLVTKKYFPFRKANKTPLYTNFFFNHLPTTIKQLPKIINKRIPDFSCNKEEIEKAKSVYETALKDSGHSLSMSFNNSNTRNAQRNRSRNVIWLNPPYNKNVKTNIGNGGESRTAATSREELFVIIVNGWKPLTIITKSSTLDVAAVLDPPLGKLFIKFVRKHFPKNNKYRLIFNLNALKLSYCCTTNVGNFIKQHNSKVVSKTNDSNNRKCNCRSKPNCPLNGECLTQCLVYKDRSTTSNFFAAAFC